MGMRSAGLAVFISVCFAHLARADITYVGNGEMPDFPQIWGQTQKMRAICEAASSADVMWYFDQNGYAGLVAHKDPKKPNDTWREDGQALVYLVGKYIYGKDPATLALSNLGQPTTIAALSKYIRDRGMYAGQAAKGAQGLVVDYYQAGN